MSRFAPRFGASIDGGGGLILRPLTLDDMPAVIAMFDDGEVARWWTSPPEEIMDHIGHAAVWPFLVTLDGKPVGYIHTYHANADEFWAAFGVPAETFGLDMFLAEQRGRGIGPRLARALVGHVWKLPEIVRFQVDPDPANARAIRAYERAGFTPHGVFPAYGGQEEMLYMTIDRG